MIEAVRQPDTNCDAVGRKQPTLWLPPHRLRQYQFAKLVGGALVALIFVGWLWIQWSNPWMRALSGTLIVVTVWIVAVSIRNDHQRSVGRQIAVAARTLTLTTPKNGEQTIDLVDISRAQWRDDELDQAGLWLLDQQDRALAHLDVDFLAEEAEARVFLAWLRRETNVSFDVCWPERG